MLKPFADEIWIADGPTVSAGAGFQYPTRMVVIRLQDGALVVCSPIALTPAIQDAVAALGDVRYLVAPNSLHHLFIAAWADAYPQAQVWAAPGVNKKLKGSSLHELDTDTPPWRGELDHVLIPGNLITTEAVLFHRRSGTAVFTDLLQQFSSSWFTGWRALVAGADLMTGAEPAVPRKFRVAFIGRAAARAAMARVLEWPTENVLMAHGMPVTRNGQAFLRRAFDWLMR